MEEVIRVFPTSNKFCFPLLDGCGGTRGSAVIGAIVDPCWDPSIFICWSAVCSTAPTPNKCQPELPVCRVGSPSTVCPLEASLLGFSHRSPSATFLLRYALLGFLLGPALLGFSHRSPLATFLFRAALLGFLLGPALLGFSH